MTGLGGWRRTIAIRIGAHVMYRRDYTLPDTARYKEHTITITRVSICDLGSLPRRA